jgi:hypothetical protein
MNRNLFYCIVFFCVTVFSVSAQKNDTIYLKNGDRITGELKKLEYGLLTLKTDAMKTLSVEIEKINTLHSSKYFEIRMSTGDRFFGHLLKSDVFSTVKVVTVTDTLAKRLWNIVLITPIKRTFIEKLDGSLDLGLSYTKASDVFQYSLSTQVTHRTNYFATRFSLESILTDDGTKVSRNNNVGLNVTHFLQGKWFTRISTQGQQNTELNLQYRLQVGYGVGYDVARTNSVRLYVLGGLVANQEKTIELLNTSENLEALFSSQVKWFRYRHPKIDVTSGINLYPSISSFGRVRIEYNLSSKFEIIKDLYFNLQFYDYYDNEPSDGGNAKSDYGIITSIGFTF